MSITKPPVKPVWAYGADPGDIAEPTALESSGWTASSAAPPYDWMNWLIKRATDLGTYLMARGVPDYDAAETYSNYDTVRGPNGTVYECINATGVTAPPSANWQVFGMTWLPSAILPNLVNLLPSQAAFITGMKTALGIGLTADISGGVFDCAGFRIAWLNGSLDRSNGYITTTTFTWPHAFGTVYGAVPSHFSVDTILSIGGLSSTDVTLVPFGAAANCTVFIVGFGTTPSS